MPATPLIKTHLTSYFTSVLQLQKERPEKGKRNNMKIRLKGETVTSDELPATAAEGNSDLQTVEIVVL